MMNEEHFAVIFSCFVCRSSFVYSSMHLKGQFPVLHFWPVHCIVPPQWQMQVVPRIDSLCSGEQLCFWMRWWERGSEEYHFRGRGLGNGSKGAKKGLSKLLSSETHAHLFKSMTVPDWVLLYFKLQTLGFLTQQGRQCSIWLDLEMAVA